MSIRFFSILTALSLIGIIAYDHFSWSEPSAPAKNSTTRKGNETLALMYERQIEELHDQIRRSQGYGTDQFRTKQRLKEIADLKKKAAAARQSQ